LALIGIALVMMSKNRRKKDLGMILLGFTVLMFGMDAMSDAVSGLRDMPEFQSILTAFTNPIMGILVGTIFTAIIQSSSASVGILQALSETGSITFSVAFPIILGQHIGTCITAMISTIGASRDAKRTGWVHLYFNILNTVLVGVLFYVVHAFVNFAFYDTIMDKVTIAVVHTVVNFVGTIFFLPMGRFLEKLAVMTVREKATEDEFRLLDERLLSSPSIALAQSEETVRGMANEAVTAMQNAIGLLDVFSSDVAMEIEEAESKVDRYEDRTGSYLIRISAQELSEDESAEAAKLQRVIGDFERISDHAVNVMESAQELREKKLKFSEQATKELAVLKAAVSEIMVLSSKAFCENDLEAAVRVEPLEQIIDDLRERIRLNHTLRLQKSECTIEHGFVLSDILTNLERVSDHCSNIAGCVLETSKDELDMHRYLASVRTESETYRKLLADYREKYTLN
ncbi:MAG: Na/Pi cotransporter family protein, partial [Clostridia bacterium]|nr:Na/Pi cotransporter family protein [Clostridia bacterium]